MSGIKALRKIQMGKETTAGTAVAATALWRGTGVIEDDRTTEFVEEDIGLISGADRTIQPKYLAKIAFEEVPATFEQLPYILAGGVEALTTAAADGSGSSKIWEHNASTNAQGTVTKFTIEGGDNQQAERMEYSFVEEFSIKGVAGEALQVSANWLGRQATTTSFTGAIAIPTVEDILMSKGKLYRDAIGGTIGTTQVTETWLAFEMKYKTGWVARFTGDGQLYFTYAHQVMPEVTIDLTLEHNSSAVSRKADWRSQTPSLWRCQWEGGAVTTAGTTYSLKTFRIDFASKIEDVEPLDEEDGNDILKFKLHPRYNVTAAKFIDFIVVNESATLT